MNYMVQSSDSAWLKLHMLVHGVEIDGSVFKLFSTPEPVALRKNFYNMPVWQAEHAQIPQELRILNLVVGLNSYGKSLWKLRWVSEESALVLENKNTNIQVRPGLVSDLRLFHEYSETSAVANLYGGAALAFFSPRSCYFFADHTECAFCSLAGTAEENNNFKSMLSEEDVRATVKAALETDADRIEQIMIVGGNMRDLDRGFKHHVSLASAAATEVQSAGRADTISIHIATMPPKDLGLLQMLKDFSNVHVMFNLEVWEPSSFSAICPGKERDYGRNAMLKALECLRDTIGPYRAHSLLVTGLESAASTINGATALATMGISPIINIYHSDRHSRLGLGVRPKFSDMAAIANYLQALYERFPILPYWRHCGRNAIDAEAQHALFNNPIPAFLGEIIT